MMKSSPVKKNTSNRISKPLLKTSLKKSLSVPGKKKQSFTKSLSRKGKQTLRAMLLSRTLHRSCKIILSISLIGALGYGSYHLIGKTFSSEDVVISKSEIISRVSKLASLPKEEPRDIVRVQDPESLKHQNEFYKDVKEGDYILMYSDIAVIYNLRDNQVVAVKLAEK